MFSQRGIEDAEIQVCSEPEAGKINVLRLKPKVACWEHKLFAPQCISFLS